MARNTVESIFNSKNNLNDFYPDNSLSPPGSLSNSRISSIKSFDLHRKHLLYGRIDKDSDAIYLDSPGSNLGQLYGGKANTLYALDFVSDAFKDLRINVNRVGNAGFIDTNSLYKTKLRAHKAWDHGDLDLSYRSYIDNMYTNFVDSYLSIDRRYEKIKNYKDFVREFLRYTIRMAKYFPVTRTGFITSVHCSPFISGLMFEIANENHGLQYNAKVRAYVNDPNFFFFVNQVKKFGFMVDKNAPWRLVFNIASGLLDKRDNNTTTGAQFYLERKGVNYDTVLNTYFRKAYLDELINIRNKFAELYTAFYIQYSTYQQVEYVTCQRKNTSTRSYLKLNDQILSRIKTTRINRRAPQVDTPEMDEFWLKVLLKLRMVETGFPHDAQNFNFYADKIVNTKRVIGVSAALSEINELTKGFRVTIFNTKGAYWHGVSQAEYEQRRREAMEHANDPAIVDYAVTGTKNIR